MKSKSIYIKIGKCLRTIIVTHYVDDLVFIGNNTKIIEEFKNDMVNKYEISDMGMLKYFIGIEI